jgi:hypothetical protein
MPKSRQRGGAKAHRKRIVARNAKLGVLRKQMQKQYTDMLEQKLKEFEQKVSADTENQLSDVQDVEVENTPIVEEQK